MRRERLVRWLATLLPQPIAQAPERVLINFACAVVAVSAFIGEHTDTSRDLLARWPAGSAQAWSLFMLAGSLCALVGYWNNPRRRWANSVERLGYLLILITSLVLGIGAALVFGWSGVRVWAIFLSIALAKAVRLLITSAFRTYLLRGGAANGNGP